VKSWLFLDRIIHPVKTVIFPSYCRLCSRLLEKKGEKVICSDCLELIEIHKGAVCPVCGRFYYHNYNSEFPCQDCLNDLPPFTRHRSLGAYAGRLKEIIILFKYRGYENLSRPLARLVYKYLAEDGLFSGVDFILPVPLYRKREKARGFNQAELLARELSRLCSIPTLPGVLVKVKNTPAQVSLEASDREVNLKGAFSVRKKEKIENRTLLLVDDVFTTGSTVKECALALKRAGAREVRAVTLARA